MWYVCDGSFPFFCLLMYGKRGIVVNISFDRFLYIYTSLFVNILTYFLLLTSSHKTEGSTLTIVANRDCDVGYLHELFPDCIDVFDWYSTNVCGRSENERLPVMISTITFHHICVCYSLTLKWERIWKENLCDRIV